MSDPWQPPRCIHGYIILGCPHDDCPTQNAYIDQQEAAMREYRKVNQIFYDPREYRRCIGCPPDGGQYPLRKVIGLGAANGAAKLDCGHIDYPLLEWINRRTQSEDW